LRTALPQPRPKQKHNDAIQTANGPAKQISLGTPIVERAGAFDAATGRQQTPAKLGRPSMSFLNQLIAFGIRQVIDPAIGDFAGLARRYFSDQSRTLPKALSRANDRAWQAIGVSLAGNGFLDRVKVFFASGDDKGIREQVQSFLEDNRLGVDGSPAEFRHKCLTELQAARQAGQLTAPLESIESAGKQAFALKRHADPTGLTQAAYEVVASVSEALKANQPNLAILIGKRGGEGPPLLVAAFAYFFRREVESNDELANGLLFDSLRQLSASHVKGLGELKKSLDSLGENFDRVFDQLGRIESTLHETKAETVATREAVLDLHAEMRRHEGKSEELNTLVREVIARVQELGMQRGEVKAQHSFSIRSEGERHAVKLLLDRFRRLPPEMQKDVPALENGLGKLLFGSGAFAEAQQTFETASRNASHPAAQAEIRFNAYRAALEAKRWSDALADMVQASTLDPVRFAPFPLHRYEPRRILGAGGFGTAFLCFDRFFNAEVVVKTLHDSAIDRSVNDVFREA
jgi:hypothetical protein